MASAKKLGGKDVPPLPMVQPNTMRVALQHPAARLSREIMRKQAIFGITTHLDAPVAPSRVASRDFAEHAN